MLDSMQPFRAREDEIPLVLAAHGMVLFDGITDLTGLLQMVRSIATVLLHRDSDQDGVTTIADLGPGYVRSGFAGFTACALNPHTDGSSVAAPPTLLIMSCRQPAQLGGECVAVDGQAIYDDLAESEPQALCALRTPRSVLFGGATGHLGAIFTDLEDDRVAIRLRRDDLVQFSPEVKRWLPALDAAIDRHTITFALAAGQGYMVNNQRWLHGRRTFAGPRVVHRVIGNPLPHVAIPPGFRPLRHTSPSTTG